MSPRSATLCVLACALALGPSAEAQRRARRPRPAPPPAFAPGSEPLGAALTQSATGAWALELTNRTSAAVPVVLDRRLVRLTFAPAATAETPSTPRARARAPRPLECRSPAPPANLDEAVSESIPAGEHRTLRFDPRELCGPAHLDALTAGANFTLSYGFAGAASLRRSLVLSPDAPPFGSLELPATTLAQTLTVEPAAEPSGDAELLLSGSRDAARPEGINLTARVRGRSQYPAWVFFRPGMVRLEVRSPWGESLSCSLSRGYAPVRDFFVPLRRGAGPSAALNLTRVCEPTFFAQPGLYRVRATFESPHSGEPFRLRAWTGQLQSSWLHVRIQRLARGVNLRALPE